MSEKVVFVLGDRLSTYYDAVISITWWQLSQKVKRCLVQSSHTLKHTQIYGRDPLVIFMLQLEAVLLISFKNS